MIAWGNESRKTNDGVPKSILAAIAEGGGLRGGVGSGLMGSDGGQGDKTRL